MTTIEEFRARVEAAPPKDLDEALLIFQADLPVLVKDKAGQAGNQKTKYADLVQANAVVIPRLNALGIVYKTKPTLRAEEPKFALAYELKHVPSGTLDDGVYPLKLSENPQHMGSAISYARRYVLLCLTGVVAEDEDDDGQAPTGRYVQRQQQRSRPAAAEAEGKPAQRAQRARPAGRPPLPGEGDQDPAGAVGEDQHRHMHALWKEVGYGGDENRDNRLNLMTRFLELEQPLESSANLTRGQADTVIEVLKAKKRELLARKAAEQAGGGEPS